MLKKLTECLEKVFQDSSYQNHLESYLSTKSIVDVVQLEHYIQQYHLNKGYHI